MRSSSVNSVCPETSLNDNVISLNKKNEVTNSDDQNKSSQVPKSISEEKASTSVSLDTNSKSEENSQKETITVPKNCDTACVTLTKEELISPLSNLDEIEPLVCQCT